MIEGGVVGGNVLTGAGADVFGADGPVATTPAGGVVGVKAGNDTSSAVTTGVGTQISGAYGKLTLNADGSYSYDGNPDMVPPLGATDVFVYTIKDGDGDTSTATLTITLTDSGIAAPNDSDVTVEEKALDTTITLPDLASGTVVGSLPGLATETDASSNQVNATSSVAIVSYELVSGGNNPTAGTYGTIKVNTDGSYVYTLTKNYLNPTADDGVQTLSGLESFQYRATDANGNTAFGFITVNIVDDVPTAHADANSVIEGGVVGGNVLTGAGADVFGADGPVATTPAGGVVGVKAGNDTSSAVTTGVGTQISGAYGKLTLNADGSYSYDGNPDMVPPLGATDVFVYTIKDGDGDTSTATLTITLTDSGIAAPNDSDVTVEEKALDTTITLPDLASGTVVGSLPGLATETDASSNQVNATSSVAIVSYELVSGGNNPTAGTYGTIKVNTDGSYVYTLTKNYLNPTADDGVQTLSGLESFQYRATDANGNTAFGFITVNIVDDVPTFTHITNAIIANADNNILVGLHNLTFGADGEQSIEITPLTSIAGLSYLAPVHNADGSVELKAQVGGADFFDLTINPDGTYTFNLIESRPTTSQTFGFGGLAGGQGTNEFTLGDATFHSVGDVLKPTSNGFGVDDGNLDTGDQFLITFSSVDIDKLSFLAEHEGSADFIMTWTTNTGETGTVSTSVNGTLAIDPIGDFTSMSFEVTGGKAKFDNFSYTKPVLPADQTLQFSIYGVDGDGDHSATQTLSITLLGAQAPNKPIMGTGGNETIKGTADADTLNGDNGSDVLNGGAGDDTLAGGNGADLFVVDGHSSAPNVGAGGTDTIEDFFASDGDQILVDVADLSSTIASALSISVDQFDFGDILTDPTAWNGNANQFYYDTSHQELWYSADGWGADKIDLAHMATGVTPADVQGGIKIF